MQQCRRRRRAGEPESRAARPEAKGSRWQMAARSATSTAEDANGQPRKSEAFGGVEPACRGDKPEKRLTRRSLLRRVRMLNEPRVTPDDRSAVDHPTRAALGGAPSPPTAAQPRALNVFSSFRAGATGHRHAGGHDSGGQLAASLAHRHAGCSGSCERISIRRDNSSLKSVGGDQRSIADPANVIKGSSAGRAVSHNRRIGGQEASSFQSL